MHVPRLPRAGRPTAVAGLAGVLLVLSSLSTPAHADGAPDVTPPQAHWDLPHPNAAGWFDHEVPVALSVTDESGIDVAASRIVVTEPDLSLHGADEPRSSIQLSVSAEGETVISYDVVDLAGNHAAGEAEISVDSIDPALGTTGLPVDGSRLVAGSRLPVGLTCSDDLAGVGASGLAPHGCVFTHGVVDGRLDTSTPGPLVVTAEARDLAGNVTTLTRHYAVVARAAAPTSVAAPRVTGRARVGAMLRATRGSWTPTPTSYSYAWLRDGRAVAGATSATYRLTRADVGRRVSVRVTASGVGGSGSATSTARVARR